MSHFFSLNLFIPLYNGGDWDRSLALLGNSLKVCGDISDCHRDGSGVYWHLVGGDQRMMVFCTETGISGNFVGRIKGAKCPFDLQFLTWDFSRDAVAGKGFILR